jgi:class 3 adenylate cyclase
MPFTTVPGVDGTPKAFEQGGTGAAGATQGQGGEQPAAAAVPPVLPAAAPRPLPAEGLRISDADRERVIEQLKVATGDGRLTLDEFSERLDVVFKARTEAELEPAFEGLPQPAAEPAVEAAVVVEPVVPQRVVAVMSGSSRKGRWRAAPRITAVAIWGSVYLDLRDAVLEGPAVDITAWAIMGSVTVKVPDGVLVEVDGTVLMGGATDRTKRVRGEAGAALVRVHCRGMWGGVDVRSSSRKERVRDLAGQFVDHAIPKAEEALRSMTGGGAGTVSILVTDIVASTAMAERLGDQRWLGVLQTHDALVREQINRHGGTEVKHVGDGFVATFPSAREAVRAALHIEQAIAGYSTAHPDSPLTLRVAVHAGEVERVGDDVFGLNVSTAAHLAAVAAPGEVLVSGVVCQLAGSTSDLRFGELRSVTLSGRSEPFVVHTARPA